MTEPEPFKGWREWRARSLAYIDEGPPSSAGGFLETCPAVDGNFDPETRELTLKFLCPRRYLDELSEGPELYDELTDALRTVVPGGLNDLSLGFDYATPDELAAFRGEDLPPRPLPPGEST
jgi:hypothetical protein